VSAATVLVVDDSPIDRRLAGALLTKRGYAVTYASDGRDALAKIKGVRPDAVVTDLMMPEMTGLELVEAIRRDHPSIPVVLMTAHGSEETAIDALRMGASSYVPKRRLADDLADTVAAIVEIAQDVGRISSVDPLEAREVKFELGADMGRLGEIIGQLEAQLVQVGICDETGVLQVGVALREAIVNAVVHGNLEVSSELLEPGGAAFAEAIDARKRQLPYSARRARVVARYHPGSVEYSVSDEGPGFDPATLPDPTDIANMERASGRGLMLIRMFMDDVTFNDKGNEIRMVKRRRPASG
jgi:CheY-like chemotaxis protein/anti-sigma regulatory factor (Ser/Thr protein kinase)